MIYRNKCAGSAWLRGSDKKKNCVKIAHERETNSLQSLIGPGKLWQAIMTVIITTTVLVVAIIILVFFSSVILPATFRNITCSV